MSSSPEFEISFRASKLKIAKLITLAMLLAISAWPGNSAGFQWPDANHYWRVLVNVNQYIENRPMEWFTQDKIITDLQILDVKPGARAAAIEQYHKLRHGLSSRGFYVGTYISGRTVGPASDQTVYPPGSVAIEQMPANARYVGSWPGQPDREIIDVRDPDTRHAFQTGIKELWEREPSSIRFVDNAAVQPAVVRGEPWKAYCDNMREIRMLAESQGSRAIFNIAMHVGLLTDEEARQLIEAIGPDNGVALEMPWHPSIQKSPEATAKAVSRYRQLLDSGLVVIMIPVDMQPSVLSDWIRKWKKPTDHLYISGIFWKAPDL
ncbi:MAG: hypothetical protein WA734_02260, partial [Candidatus Acidiferrales bacterium]